MDDHRAEIGIIGGTGVYDPEQLEHPEDIKVYTPYGAPSDLITIGTIKGKRIAFLKRHGRGHQIPPHKLPNQANIWALKSLGVKQVVASSAVGSLREDYKPGDFVLTDQFIDRTKKRLDTFYDGGQLCHISAADPICPQLHEYFGAKANELGLPVHMTGTYVCIEGPRFSTRAESRLFRQWGCDIIGMTLYPEVILAREAQLCYVSIAMVTDYDVWAEKPVSTREVLETMDRNSENFKKLVTEAIPKIPETRSCGCGDSLWSALL